MKYLISLLFGCVMAGILGPFGLFLGCLLGYCIGEAFNKQGDFTSGNYTSPSEIDCLTSASSIKTAINPETGFLMMMDKRDIEYAEETCLSSTFKGPEINPATGLPMIGGLDIAGNPYGVDISDITPKGSEMNPATGLPMMGGMVGGLDIAGNPYGTDISGIAPKGSEINPATGFPMMGGMVGGLDIAGNPYGTDLNDHYCGSPLCNSFGSEGVSNDW